MLPFAVCYIKAILFGFGTGHQMFYHVIGHICAELVPNLIAHLENDTVSVDIGIVFRVVAFVGIGGKEENSHGIVTVFSIAVDAVQADILPTQHEAFPSQTAAQNACFTKLAPQQKSAIRVRFTRQDGEYYHRAEKNPE